MTDVWDVVVCGGGTAGVVAAIAAGRKGAKTLIVERYGALGGTQTHGMVTPMMPNYLGDYKLSRGIGMEISAKQAEFQRAVNDVEHYDSWFDPTALPLILDQMATDAGVVCLFDTDLFKVKREGRSISAIQVASRSGNMEIEGKAFIDCTGDAVLSMYAGAELMCGNEDGVHQPMTLRFTMGNVDLEKFRKATYPYLKTNTENHLEAGFAESKNSPISAMVQAAVDKGILFDDDLGYFQFFTANGRTNELALNMPRIVELDPLDPFAISKAYQMGRGKIFRIVEFMKRYFDGCQNAYVSSIAPMMGVRESRRVVGEYILTEDDHQSFARFDDAIARNRYPIDIHLKKGSDYRKYPEGKFHEIPYRSIIAKGFDNLWVAGRCISATFVAQSAIRIQPICRATGEAAGFAAAIAVKKGLSARSVPYLDLSGCLDLSLP
jgi:hypothetical protein